MLSKFISLILIIVTINSNLVYAKCDCKEDEVTVVFFNGMKNEYDEAQKSKREMQRRLGKIRSGIKLNYKLFYNSTAGYKADIFEYMDQYLREEGSSLMERYEIFYHSSAYNSFLALEKIYDRHNYETLIRLRELKRQEIITELAKSNTAREYCIHNEDLEKLMNDCKKILFVAHSQGNLFVNQAYKRAMARNYSKDRIKVLHIAPPLPEDKLNGDYLLSFNDSIINIGLKFLDIKIKVPKSNYYPPLPFPEIPNQKTEFFGHSFLETYLNPKLDIFKETQRLIDKNLAELKC